MAYQTDMIDARHASGHGWMRAIARMIPHPKKEEQAAINDTKLKIRGCRPSSEPLWLNV
jgi:hypothetical protein